MEDNSLKYEITDEMIDSIIYSASKKRDIEIIEDLEREYKSRKVYLYYLRPLFYAIIVAIILFSIAAFIKAANKESKNIKPSTTFFIDKSKRRQSTT